MRSDPVLALLMALESVAKPGPVDHHRHDELAEKAQALYLGITVALRSLPLSEDQPKGKLILHLPHPEANVEEVDIELEGPLADLINVSAQRSVFKWTALASALADRTVLVDEWRESLQRLIRASRTASYDKSDQVISSFDLTRFYRMFVPDASPSGMDDATFMSTCRR